MSSDSERDDALDDDLEALRRACMITGTAPEAVAGVLRGGREEERESEEELNDLDLARVIQQRFSIPSNVFESLPAARPSIPPSDSDSEDDFEILHAVQRRFEQYRNESSKKTHLFTEDTGKSSGDGYEDPRTSDQTSHELGSTHGTGLQSLIQDSAQWDQPEDGTRKGSAATARDFRFPKSCLMIVDSLKKNRSLQKFFRNKLVHVEAKIAENKELRDRMKCLLDFQASCKRRVGKILSQKKDPCVKLISLPKLVTKKGGTKSKVYFGPAENCHVENYKMLRATFPVSLLKHPWSALDQEKLVKGIKQQYQEMMLLDSMELANDLEHSGDVNALELPLVGNCDVTSPSCRSFLHLVNWERLASMYFSSGRTAAECEARWLNCEDPLINDSPWTADEEKMLLHICQESGFFNWIDIASKLGTCRTPFKCLMRYQRSLNVHILKKEWTKDEDAQLRAALEIFGKDWQLVASTLAGRTGAQCSNRWREVLLPGKVMGRWSAEEDRRLKVAVTLLGAKNWSKVVQFVSGRNQHQCRERWVNVLNPWINLGPWTEEDDTRLKDAIDKFGYCWSDIANYVSHRTDAQCRRRWKVLFPEEVPLLRTARKLQKAALISNFVDREDERPLIGPSDFQAAASICGSQEPCKKRKKSSSNVVEQSSDSLQHNSAEDIVADGAASLAMMEDGQTHHCENNTGTIATKKKNKPRPTRKKNKPRAQPGKEMQTSDEKFDNGSAVTNPPHEESQNGNSMNDPAAIYASSQGTHCGVKISEYTIPLKNAKRGRSRIRLKRNKSAQFAQNDDIVSSADAETHVEANASRE